MEGDVPGKGRAALCNSQHSSAVSTDGEGSLWEKHLSPSSLEHLPQPRPFWRAKHLPVLPPPHPQHPCDADGRDQGPASV